MSDNRKLISALTEARKQRGWSQRDLAEKLEMKQSQISEIEAGKRDLRTGTLVDIARCLGLELVLVPRRSLPAVSYLLQSGSARGPEEEASIYGTWEEGD
ncbi:MAG TPA: helix-turn-helix transcriptional regulator [Candidatus Obscuribacterales bacterium]